MLQKQKKEKKERALSRSLLPLTGRFFDTVNITQRPVSLSQLGSVVSTKAAVVFGTIVVAAGAFMVPPALEGDSELPYSRPITKLDLETNWGIIGKKEYLESGQSNVLVVKK